MSIWNRDNGICRSAVFGMFLLAGCRTVDYYAQAIGGQVEVLSKRRPVEEVMAETDDPELRERLALTLRVLEFARQELRMDSGGSYELYADLGREHLVWVLFAAPELTLEPKDWWYPVVGRQDYRGFFREDPARAEVGRLEEAGYETWLHEVDAFSTLGWFRDPVLNTFVKREEVDFVELLLHELCHLNYYERGNTAVNEGLAEAVAREGVRRWFKATGRPELAAKYEARLGRLEQSREAIEGTADRLRGIYESTRTDDEKRAAKRGELRLLKERLRALRAEWNGGLKDWIDKPVNNARLNSFTTYETEVRRFAELLEECGGDFARFWDELGEE